LSSNYQLIATHVVGTLVPDLLVARAVKEQRLKGIITLSETTRQYLLQKGVPADRTWVVPPGVDENWLAGCITDEERNVLRAELGFGSSRFLVAYFGSPAPVRGLHTTLRAIERAAQSNPELGMIVLSRRHSDEWRRQAAQLDELICRDGLRDRVKVVDGYLEQEDLIRYLLASDIVCLPFELVPSDVPLSILEAMALGKGVIGTEVACLPELLADGRGFLVPPASVSALTRQIQLLANQPEQAIERGRVGSRYVRDHRTWADMGHVLEQVLDRVNEG
jgi:glycosyltransferase involved in cell wall biosynthesis